MDALVEAFGQITVLIALILLGKFFVGKQFTCFGTVSLAEFGDFFLLLVGEVELGTVSTGTSPNTPAGGGSGLKLQTLHLCLRLVLCSHWRGGEGG